MEASPRLGALRTLAGMTRVAAMCIAVLSVGCLVMVASNVSSGVSIEDAIATAVLAAGPAVMLVFMAPVVLGRGFSRAGKRPSRFRAVVSVPLHLVMIATCVLLGLLSLELASDVVTAYLQSGIDPMMGLYLMPIGAACVGSVEALRWLIKRWAHRVPRRTRRWLTAWSIAGAGAGMVCPAVTIALLTGVIWSETDGDPVSYFATPGNSAYAAVGVVGVIGSTALLIGCLGAARAAAVVRDFIGARRRWRSVEAAAYLLGGTIATAVWLVIAVISIVAEGFDGSMTFLIISMLGASSFMLVGGMRMIVRNRRAVRGANREFDSPCSTPVGIDPC